MIDLAAKATMTTADVFRWIPGIEPESTADGLSQALTAVISLLSGFCFVIFISAITDPPWELFRPASLGLFTYLMELLLATIVFVMVSAIAFGALSSI